MELKAFSSYRRKNLEINFWRSVDRYEVDFIVNGKTAIEVKSTKYVTEAHLKGLKAIQQESQIKQCLIVSDDPRERVVGSIHVIPWRIFLQRLWANQLFA